MQHKSKRHKLIWKVLLLLLLVVSPHNGVQAAEENKIILVINAYNEVSPWSGGVSSLVMHEISRLPYIACEENMNLFTMTQEKMDLFVKNLFIRYEGEMRPSILMLMGNAPFSFREEIKQHWGDIPIILCGEDDYMIPDSYYISGQHALEQERIPLQSLLRDYNFTLMQGKRYIPENIELIHTLMPGLKKIIFGSDSLYINQRHDEMIRRYLNEHHPDITYERVIAGRGEVNNLLKRLNSEEKSSTALLLGSWLYVSTNLMNINETKNSMYRILSNAHIPTFGVKEVGMRDGNLTGGYVYNHEEYAERLKEVLHQVINGRPPREIPFFSPSAGPVINYPMLSIKGVNEELCPKESRYINKPAGFWETYGWYMAALAAIAAIFTFLQQRRIQILNILKRANQKELEVSRQYSELVANMPIIYIRERIFFDKEGNPTDAVVVNSNKKDFTNMLNEKPEDEKEQTSTDFRATYLNFIKIVLTEKRPVTFSFYYRAKKIFFEVVINNTTEPDMVDIFCMDSTDLHTMQQQLRDAKERAEESNRLKSAFLANMSHEIRTPLNAIVGFSSILADVEDEGEKREYISIIENNNTLLLQLISDILDLSKIEAGTLEFVYTDIDLNAVMEEIRNVFQLRLINSPVKLRMDLGRQGTFPLHTEKTRLSQVLTNLLTNACKFTEKGSICFGYTLYGNRLHFYVTDTGCGIPADKQDGIFGRFVKLNAFAQGTGLGLSICQNIVHHMGGEIGVDSEEGKGSTFWFDLPYVSMEENDNDAENEEVRPVTVQQQKLTILIAEDDDTNYILFNSILGNDYHLIHAWNGREALELYKQYRPHLILMDINMPEMDGHEATKEIRKLSATVPIIAITAYAYASDEQRAFKNGANGYMAKPVKAPALQREISEMLKKRIVLM